MPPVKKRPTKSRERSTPAKKRTTASAKRAAPARKRPAKSRTLTAAQLAADMGLKTRLGARTEYRIYPSIGIARVGDSQEAFIIGPEAPGIAPSGPFRDATPDKRLKPQAARFRIYRVEIDAHENEKVVEEIVPGNDIEIKWTVELANRKAAGPLAEPLLLREKPTPRNKGRDRKKLVISARDSIAGARARTGSTTIGPTLSGDIEFAPPRKRGTKFTNIVLAKLGTDDHGRLLVIGGPGESEGLPEAGLRSFIDNDDWYDSVSDGPVSATLRIDGQSQPVVPAWVTVTVPAYAPGVYGIVTWYDQAVNMARTSPDGRFEPPRTTSFTRDIYPILKRADALSGVQRGAHSGNQQLPLSSDARIESLGDLTTRQHIFSHLARPGEEATAPDMLPSFPDRPWKMPFLRSGANPDPDPDGPAFTWLALTAYQFAHVENWVRGNFTDDWSRSAPRPKKFDDIPVGRQAWALNEAALEACVGASFYPGIEGTYDIARLETYHPEFRYRREFRIDPAHPPGFLSEKMALPWQADFAACGDSWWPSQRPVNVTTEDGEDTEWDRGITDTMADSYLNMVAFWHGLGVVVWDDDRGEFVETERTYHVPTV